MRGPRFICGVWYGFVSRFVLFLFVFVCLSESVLLLRLVRLGLTRVYEGRFDFVVRGMCWVVVSKTH